MEIENKRLTDVGNSWKANCLAHFVGLLGLRFSLPLLSLSLWCFASYFFIYPSSFSSLPLSQSLSQISPSFSDIRQQISITVIVFQADLIAVDLIAHVMISALFNSCSCNQLFLFLFFKKKGTFAVDVIRDLMVCEVACRLSGSYLEQSGRALINRLKEEADRA